MTLQSDLLLDLGTVKLLPLHLLVERLEVPTAQTSLPGSPCRVVPSLNKQSCGLPKLGQEQGQQRNGLSAPSPGCVDHQHFCCKI